MTTTIHDWINHDAIRQYSHTTFHQLCQTIQDLYPQSTDIEKTLQNAMNGPLQTLSHPLISHQHYTTCHSTQDLAKDYLMCEDQPALFTTDYQHNGYGRNGRWHGSFGQHIQASWVIPKISSPMPISMMVCYQIFSYLSPLIKGAKLSLKWPNDILIDDKKVTGIIAESSACDKFWIIGVGLNLSQDEDLQPTTQSSFYPTYLDRWTHTPSRGQILSDLTDIIAQHLDAASPIHHAKIHEEWNKHDHFMNQHVRSTDRHIEGIGCGIKQQGHYIIAQDSEILTPIFSGRIQIVQPSS